MNYINTPDIEREYVLNCYNIIAERFSQTRGYLWKGVKNFVNDIPTESSLLEVGCGNGKNLYRKDLDVHACDICSKFCDMVRNTKPYVKILQSCNLDLPYQDESMDYVLSVAVIHHFSTHERRHRAISELLRVLKVNGKLYLQVWAVEQPKKSRRRFSHGENLVPFNPPNHNSPHDVNHRFYWVFKKNELRDMFLNYNVEINNIFLEEGNWVAIVTKL
uniref:Methyltransferase domain protein n=1 Tax=Megaviridae environmental sample TaxID=1737588 RepID=A0A5J6VJF8_9VIRU|nr:MAG: methyltransferase domain protein [Megaviridae environmental sample]